jgi:hypothetical protein
MKEATLIRLHVEWYPKKQSYGGKDPVVVRSSGEDGEGGVQMTGYSTEHRTEDF